MRGVDAAQVVRSALSALSEADTGVREGGGSLVRDVLARHRVVGALVLVVAAACGTDGDGRATETGATSGTTTEAASSTTDTIDDRLTCAPTERQGEGASSFAYTPDAEVAETPEDALAAVLPRWPERSFTVEDFERVPESDSRVDFVHEVDGEAKLIVIVNYYDPALKWVAEYVRACASYSG